MPFEHGATTQWGRWLRRIFAGRSPGTQVVGQEVEDSLRATIKVADLTHLTEPIGWAQAVGRRQTGLAVLDVSRVELHCQSPGGLWVRDLSVGTAGVFWQIEDAPVSVPTRVGIEDFGTIPTVSLLGDTTVTEAVQPITTPQFVGGVFTIRNGATPIYLPFGKVLLLRGLVLNAFVNVEFISWIEIPAAR